MFNYLRSSSTKELIAIFGYCLLIALAATLVSLAAYFLGSGSQSIGFLSAIADFWGLILGLPITAAGAIFAIMLAQRSIDISDQQVVQGKISIALAEKVAEQEALSVVTKQWEDTAKTYTELSEAIKECDNLCREIHAWHNAPKKYLAYRSSELTLCAGSDVDELNKVLNKIRVKNCLTAEELKQLVEESFKVNQCASLVVKDNELLIDKELNVSLAAQQLSEFSAICDNLRLAINKVSDVLIKLSLSPMGKSLWIKRFSQLTPTTYHEQAQDYYSSVFESFTGFSHREKNIHAEPNKLAVYLNKYSMKFDVVDMFLASQDTHLSEHSTKLKLLDICRPLRVKDFKKSPSKLPFEGLVFTETEEPLFRHLSGFMEIDGPFSPDGLYRGTAYRALGWALIADIIRLMPTQETLATYISERFDFDETQSTKIADLVFTDFTHLFRSINGVDNHTISGEILFTDYADFQNEDFEGYVDIRSSCSPLHPTLIASENYLSFVKDVFSNPYKVAVGKYVVRKSRSFVCMTNNLYLDQNKLAKVPEHPFKWQPKC